MMINKLIENIVKSSKVNKIIVNGAIATVVQDMGEFEALGGVYSVNGQYILGNVGQTQIVVDPMIRYQDLRILNEDNLTILDLSLLGYTALDII